MAPKRNYDKFQARLFLGRFGKDNTDLDDLNKLSFVQNILKDANHGDLVVNCDDCGYRMEGVYSVCKRNGVVKLIDLEYEGPDEYGTINHYLEESSKFHPTYWDDIPNTNIVRNDVAYGTTPEDAEKNLDELFYWNSNTACPKFNGNLKPYVSKYEYFSICVKGDVLYIVSTTDDDL